MNKRGLFALAMGTFALGITEFLTMGILGTLAADMEVGISRAGAFISSYAAGVCVGAPALLFARKMALKKLMLILAGVITVGNMLASVAPEFWSFCAARFISGLPHGAYFGVGAIVARRLASPSKAGSAVAMMIGGMTVATLAGVPLGTLISNVASWRVAYVIVGLSGAATFVALRYWVPQVPGLEDMGFKGQFRFLRTLPPWLVFGGVLLGQIGIYSWYSFIDPQLTSVAGFSRDSMSWLMAIAGFGMFAGNLIAGRLSDRFKPAAVAAWVQASAIPVLVLFFFLGHYKVAAVLLMVLGTAALFGSGSPLQSDIVGYARGGEMLGAACIQIAYNVGNAVAAWYGGVIIRATGSYMTPAVAGLPLVAVGVVLLAWLYFRYERAGSGTAR